jgi:hypothetical protein
MRENAKDKPYPYSEYGAFLKSFYMLAAAKKQAQRALNKLYELFKIMKGLVEDPLLIKK